MKEDTVQFIFVVIKRVFRFLATAAISAAFVLAVFGGGVAFSQCDAEEIAPPVKPLEPPAVPHCSFTERATLETLGDAKSRTLLFDQPLWVHNPTDRPIRLALWCRIVAGPTRTAETKEERVIEMKPLENRREAVWISWRNVFVRQLQHRYKYHCGCREIKPPPPSPPGQGVLTSTAVPTEP